LPYKVGRATTVILHDEEWQAIREMRKVLKVSQTEIIRRLIRMGIEAMRNV
jgi:hypothetical protein